MRKTADRKMIGAFVLGAIALIIVGVALFGSGIFLQNRQKYETYFQGSVKGLTVGAPVMFHGVEVGTVRDISLEFVPAQLVFHIQVIFDVSPDRAKIIGQIPKRGEFLGPLIDKGLRAQLIISSIITGQLAVTLDFFPDKPPVFIGHATRYPEIPSVPSSTEELGKTLQEIPIKDIFLKLDSAIAGIDSLVNSKSMQASLKSLESIVNETRGLMRNLNDQMAPLAESLQETSGEIRSTVSNLNDALQGEGGLIESSRKSLMRAEQVFRGVQQMVGDNSSMAYDLELALIEMRRSLRSLRTLSDYLERHPEAIIRGKRQ